MPTLLNHRVAPRHWRVTIAGVALALSLVSGAVAVLLVTEARASLRRQVSRTQVDQARYAARLIADELRRRSDVIYANVFHGVRGDLRPGDPGPSLQLVFQRLQDHLGVSWPRDSSFGAFRYMPGQGITEAAGNVTGATLRREVQDSLDRYLHHPRWGDVIDANLDVAVGDEIVGGWFIPLGATPADGVVGVTFSRRMLDTLLVNDALRNVPLLPPSITGAGWKMGRPIAGQERLGIELVNIASGKRMVSIPVKANGQQTFAGTYRIETGSHGYSLTVEIPSRADDPATLSRFSSVSPFLAIALLVVAASLAIVAIWTLGVEHRDVRARQAFLSKVSHELRTPLSLISGYAESLQRGTYTTPDARARATDGIQRSAQHLGVLVENVLTLSRSETPGWQLSLRRLDFSDTVRTTVELLAPLAAARGATIKLALDVPAYVRGDAHALRQVVTNLVDNAIKYGPDRQHVTVMLSTSAEHVTLTVDDQGHGISAHVRDRIGTLFLRGDHSSSAHAPGTGIGLAVADEIVRRHGGRLTGDTSATGGGQFTVVIPRAANDAIDRRIS
ncbi:MAG TPA: HAMP domain-containing sensor histidine kinase [Candidatus Elarobacter sp.]|nr:HAMP domain-containing sensor histidine kinase [Candidatus Elarobacter sp.]